MSKARLGASLAKTLLHEGAPGYLVNIDAGIGDDLLCTVIFHELRKRGAKRLWMMSRYREIFEGNRDVDRVVPHELRYPSLARKVGRMVLPYYDAYHPEIDECDPPTKHIISIMCEKAGITGAVKLRPYIVLTSKELEGGKRMPRQITIQTSNVAARWPMKNKQWPQSRFQEVVNSLKGEYSFIQVGSHTDPPLQGVLDLRGKTSIRETAAILNQSIVFVGLVGFAMHLARAVDCRSVIVYGGREPASLTGYSCNENLERRLPCAPCWRFNTCAYDHECMAQILPDHVVSAIRRQAERVGEALVEDSRILN